VEACRLFIEGRRAYFIPLDEVPRSRETRALGGLQRATRSYCSQTSLLPAADPVLKSFQLKVRGNDIEKREREERSPDFLPGIHFTLEVDKEQGIITTMGA